MISEINLQQHFYQTMTWFCKRFIKFCKSFINLIKLISTRTCSSARVRPGQGGREKRDEKESETEREGSKGGCSQKL